MAYGGSQTRGLIRAVAASLHTATAMWDPSHVYNLYHSSRQCWILNPLSEPRDQTHNLMVPSRIHFHCATTGPPQVLLEYDIKDGLFIWQFTMSTENQPLIMTFLCCFETENLISWDTVGLRSPSSSIAMTWSFLWTSMKLCL